MPPLQSDVLYPEGCLTIQRWTRWARSRMKIPWRGFIYIPSLTVGQTRACWGRTGVSCCWSLGNTHSTFPLASSEHKKTDVMRQKKGKKRRLKGPNSPLVAKQNQRSETKVFPFETSWEMIYLRSFSLWEKPSVFSLKWSRGGEIVSTPNQAHSWPRFNSQYHIWSLSPARNDPKAKSQE